MENYWINKNQNKPKIKACGFCMQRITLIITQIKGNIKNDM